MNRRTKILATAALAISGFSIPSGLVHAADTAADLNGKVASDPRDQRNELHGVQKLLSQAANAAMSDNGIDQLAGLFVAETDGGRALRDAGAANNNVAPGITVAPAAKATPDDSRAQRTVNPSDHAALVKRFNADWHAKYHEDFRISDQALVFNDIAPDDLRRSHRDTPLQLTPPATQPAEPGSARVNPAVPAGTPGANRTNSVTNPNNLRTASGAVIPRTDPESLKPLTQKMVVHVRGIGDAAAVDLHLMRKGPEEFSFVSTGPIDPAGLRIDVDRHLAAAMVDEPKWPADVHQAQRAIAQHLLMAVAEYESGVVSGNGEPAAARVPANPGVNPANSPR